MLGSRILLNLRVQGSRKLRNLRAHYRTSAQLLKHPSLTCIGSSVVKLSRPFVTSSKSMTKRIEIWSTGIPASRLECKNGEQAVIDPILGSRFLSIGKAFLEGSRTELVHPTNPLRLVFGPLKKVL